MEYGFDSDKSNRLPDYWSAGISNRFQMGAGEEGIPAGETPYPVRAGFVRSTIFLGVLLLAYGWSQIVRDSPPNSGGQAGISEHTKPSLYAVWGGVAGTTECLEVYAPILSLNLYSRSDTFSFVPTQ